MIDVNEDLFALEHFTKAEEGVVPGFVEEILSEFTCILCYGIVIDPVKCEKCETIYCYKCLPPDAFGKPKADRYGPSYTCYKKCGSAKLKSLGRIEKNILNNLPFKCQHSDEHNCEAVLKYEDIKRHLKHECVTKITDIIEYHPFEYKDTPKPVLQNITPQD